MVTSICIPWRAAADRLLAYRRVRAFWDEIGWPILQADSNPDLPFQLSEARNNAVRQCDDGVVIVADADTIPELNVIHEAVELAERRNCVVYPFTGHAILPASAARAHDLTAIEPLWVKSNSVGGVFVCHTDTYWLLGGNDELFEPRWGFEDNAFCAAAETLAEVIRLPGKIWSFTHSVEGGRDWSDKNPNYWRNELYKFATGKPEIMRELLKR